MQKINIPFLSLKNINDSIADELKHASQRVIHSGRYLLEKDVTHFENQFADYCHAQYCIGVSSGLDALRLCLEAYDIGPGDEVIVPSVTYIATWFAVTQVGAQLVPVEPDTTTYNISPDHIEKAITPKTRAIIAVHMYGQLAAMDQINHIAKKHQLILIEDAAQSPGACINQRKAGTWGDAAAFSFYPAKNLGALGDGGAVTTNNPDIAKRIRTLHNQGSTEKYHHSVIGYSARLDALQAAFLSVKLPYLDHWNHIRRQHAMQYTKALENHSHVIIPTATTPEAHVWHLFVIRCPQRDALKEHLLACGVEAHVHYPIPPHLQPAYKKHRFSPLPLSEKIHQDVLSLPIGPHLNKEDIQYVIESLLEFPFS